MTVLCRFYQDDYGPYIHRHDVLESEVQAVMAHPGEVLSAFGGARMALGQIERGGRYLRVVFVPDPEFGVAFVLVAFTLRGEVLRACRRRQRGRRVHYRLRGVGQPIAHSRESGDPPTGLFPPGWDEKRVWLVIRHYAQQDWAAQVAEDEAAV